jgi:hypothetical protein
MRLARSRALWARTRPARSRALFVSAALGAWLFGSAFLWEPTAPEFYNACVTGAAVCLLSLVAWARVGWLHFGLVGLSAWLFTSTILMQHDDGRIAFNNLLVSVGLLVCAFFPLQETSEPLTSWTTPPS